MEVIIIAGELDQILERGKNILFVANGNKDLLSNALGNLTLARAYQDLEQPKTASTYFNLAVLGIQKAGTIIFMPEFYLARADFYLSQNDLPKAAADIKTANHTINRCGMNLYAIDAALLNVRYCLALPMPDQKQAAQFCEQAEMLIDKMGYHLRDKALAELKQCLNQD